jgi:hypothetical protein
LEKLVIKPILFSPGEILATPGAVALGVDLMPYLFRHLTGDWGDVDEFDKQQNDLAVKDGSRILSAYQTPAGKLWLISESDRSATTFLLPDEY